MNNKKKSNKWLTWLLLLLIAFVSLTTMVYVDRLRNYLPDDSGSLPITGEVSDNDKGDSSDKNEGSGNTNSDKPGFVIYDDNGIWNMESSVELFRISYENGEKEITVVSDDGEKIIAPGTNLSYTFKLKNTGNVALDYTMYMKAYITPEDTPIPVETKLSRFDGKWVVGGVDHWTEISMKNLADDTFTLGPGRYSYYVLDWQWPFEGDDELDTYLGNEAITQNITFTIELSTEATVSMDTESTGGILATPNTGDNSQVLLFAIIGGCALIFILILIIKLRDEDEEDEK